MRRSHLVYISVTLADSLSKRPVVQLLQSVFDMSALCANTSTQTVSPCVDSSVNNVLLQTNPDFNQSLLSLMSSSTFLNGLMEFAGVDKAARSKMGCGKCRSGHIGTIWQGWTMQEWTIRHHVAGMEFAGVDKSA